MELPPLKQFGWMAIVGIVLYSLLKLNLFVTHADLEQSLRTLESKVRGEYATRQDIQDIKHTLDTLNNKLDRLYEKRSTS